MDEGAEKFLQEAKKYPLIDVRSPAEYDSGHIPGAKNIPIFNNEERAIVGTLYKQSGRYDAILRGLDIVGPKMSSFLKQVMPLARQKKVLVHCWRGGMRSESMAWLFAKAGLESKILSGGYKAYRAHIREQWSDEKELLILGGMTGSGKTDLLLEIEKQGRQVIDLEGRAHHKGSAFGAIGQPAQPTTEQFENDLADYWQFLSSNEVIWVEDESRAIGTVSLPEPFYHRMRHTHVIKIDLPKKYRIQRLVHDYTGFDDAVLEAAIHRIQKRLGGQHEQEAVEALKHRDYEKVADITLEYYDKAYLKGLSHRDPSLVHSIQLDHDNVEENATRIIEFYQKEVK